MTLRVFRAADQDGRTILHDPCSGVTRWAPRPIPPGRCLLDDQETATWLTASPAEVHRPVPVSVCWSPLVRCNLLCPHCLDDKTVTEADSARRVAIGRILSASEVLGIDISGGEPLLLRDLPTLASQLASGGCVVSVTTNGWHLARRLPDLAGSIDAVRVSLDGPDARRHDAVRGPGSFDRAISGIRACTRAAVPVQIQTVLMASAARHAQTMVNLAAEVGATGVTFLQMLPIGEGSAMAPQEMLSDAAAAHLISNLAVPPRLGVRLRRREHAAGFTVIRADGRIWRNDAHALAIAATRPLTRPQDLTLADVGEPA